MFGRISKLVLKGLRLERAPKTLESWFFFFQFITGPANDIIRLQDEKKCLNEIKKKIKQDAILMATYKGDLWTRIKLLSMGEGLSF